ncbi:3-hydroxybutyrate dehydrogenase [Mesorhizobium sp. M2C.T.Ca.TU.009.01.2.1]|nr:3-hydroxybutyrate dehydrogenase [Mesorhizobium sp. M2C.T.Ca.TU.009.01.2.1]
MHSTDYLGRLFGLEGRHAFVTGASRGLGLAFAEALAAAGARVTIGGRKADELKAAGDRLRAEGYAVAEAVIDVTDTQSVDAAIAASEAGTAPIDILVNNAGIQHVAPIEEFPDDKWEAIIRINLLAAFYAIKAAVPGMKSRKWGRIINTASAHALVASPFKSAYVSAKHGIAGLTKTVALEVAQNGITVNAIAPGYVWTPLVEKQIPDTMKARGMTEEQVKHDVLLAAQPTKEFVTVEELAALALFLCSDAAKQITGTTLPMDGGWTAQ